MRLKVFVDFDGTITKHDVGNAFFREFGGEVCTSYVNDYRAGKISAKDLFVREVQSIHLLDQKKADEFLRRQEMDGSFKTFVEFCRTREIEFHVVSDGLDYYIKKILSSNGVDGVSFFANTLEVEETSDGRQRLSISFPYDDAECTRCGCCKRNIILTRSGDDDIIVYIGEGYSDRCPVQYADIVFAKDELQKFCQERNISYFLYDCFDDVVVKLNDLLGGKTLKPRREAAMKRREAFRTE